MSSSNCKKIVHYGNEFSFNEFIKKKMLIRFSMEMDQERKQN